MIKANRSWTHFELHISRLERDRDHLIRHNRANDSNFHEDPFSLSDSSSHSVVKISLAPLPLYRELCPFDGGLSHVSPMLATYVRQSWPHSRPRTCPPTFSRAFAPRVKFQTHFPSETQFKRCTIGHVWSLLLRPVYDCIERGWQRCATVRPQFT